VIQVLRKSNVPEQSRVWWCPTSAFCSLPLHAMGPFVSDDGQRSISPTCISPHTPQHSPRSSSLADMVQRRSINHRCFWSHSQMHLFRCEGRDRVVQALKTQMRALYRKTQQRSQWSRAPGSQLVHFACHGTLEDGSHSTPHSNSTGTNALRF